MKEDEIPPAWSYNPATWAQRIPIIALAIIGFLIAGYLSLYQFKILSTVWEPFFGNGSVKILNSPISHVLPIPDEISTAGLQDISEISVRLETLLTPG